MMTIAPGTMASEAVVVAVVEVEGIAVVVDVAAVSRIKMSRLAIPLTVILIPITAIVAVDVAAVDFKTAHLATTIPTNTTAIVAVDGVVVAVMDLAETIGLENYPMRIRTKMAEAIAGKAEDEVTAMAIHQTST